MFKKIPGISTITDIATGFKGLEEKFSSLAKDSSVPVDKVEGWLSKAGIIDGKDVTPEYIRQSANKVTSGGSDMSFPQFQAMLTDLVASKGKGMEDIVSKLKNADF